MFPSLSWRRVEKDSNTAEAHDASPFIEALQEEEVKDEEQE